jgi:HPt (histidine-containing phosphotransfer) domain-containing protein
MTTADITDDINWTAVLDRFENDKELLREVVALFLDDCPRRLDELRAAVLRGDRAAVEQVAHSIKGSVANFAAATAVTAAQRLEMIGRDGDMTTAGAACSALEQEVNRLSAALVHLT